jgi:hypothetical protein
MTCEFEFITEAPEDSFLGCRMATTEEIVARELEARHNLELGDVRVEKIFKDAKPHFQVYRLKIHTIDCSKDWSWMEAFEDCLKNSQAFELLNATPAHIARLEPIFAPYADWFSWSDKVAPVHRRSFRPLPMSDP